MLVQKGSSRLKIRKLGFSYLNGNPTRLKVQLYNQKTHKRNEFQL